MTKKRKDYIIIPNSVFYDRDINRWLTTEELYAYSWIFRNRRAGDWITVLSVDTMSTYCRFAAKRTNGTDIRNKNKNKDVLISLIGKGYVKEANGQLVNKELKNSDTLEIEINLADKKGYSQIEYFMFHSFQDPLELQIYAYINCLDKEGKDGNSGKRISYPQWEEILKVKTDKIIEMTNKMSDPEYKNRIWKFSGEWIENSEEARQMRNMYYTDPDRKIRVMWNGFYRKAKGLENVGRKVSGVGLKRKIKTPFDA